MNSSKYFYASLTIQWNNHSFTHSKNHKAFLFQTIRLSVSYLLAFSLNVKSSIGLIGSGATTQYQSGPESEVHCILQGYSYTGTAPSVYLMSYPVDL